MSSATHALSSCERAVCAMHDCLNPLIDADAAMEGLPRLLARIAAQEEVRFFMDGTKNLGHQSASVSMLKRLIELTDYAGVATLVYADYQNAFLGSITDKIALFFPGVDPRRLDGAVVTHHARATIRIVRSDDAGALAAPAEFGFTGGADDMSANYARLLNVRYFARLQPYLWDDDASHKSDPYYESSRIEDSAGNYFYLVDACGAFAHLIHKPPPSRYRDVESAVWRWYIDEQRFDVGLGVRTANIKAVLEVCAREDGPLLWPLYGLQHFKDGAANIVRNCVALAVLAQSSLRRSVLVVSVVPDDSTLQLTSMAGALIDDIRTDKTSAINLRLIDGFDPSRGCYLDVRKDLREMANDQDCHCVCFISVGPIPSVAFDRLITSAQIPCVIEGQATSSLAVAQGKPFFQIPRPGHLITNSYPQAMGQEDCRSMSQRVNAAAEQLRYSGRVPLSKLAQALAGALQIILDSRNPESDVSVYFRRVCEYFGADRRDKFLVGCRALAEFVERQDDAVVE